MRGARKGWGRLSIENPSRGGGSPTRAGGAGRAWRVSAGNFLGGSKTFSFGAEMATKKS